MHYTVNGAETVLTFATSQAAWRAMRALGAAGLLAGFPNWNRANGSYDVRVVTTDPKACMDAVSQAA